MTEADTVMMQFVCTMIADTFDVPASAITLETLVDDVPGWDSLGHSVLMTRLARLLKLGVTETDAGFVGTVGELVARLSALIARGNVVAA